MQAIQINHQTKELFISDYPNPIAGESELLVDVKATALNRADLMQKKGFYPPPKGASSILGLEMAGIVSKVGDKVTNWKEGDRVFALLPGGGYAQKVSVPADMAIRIPENLSFEEAAAIPEAFLTAYLKLVILGKAEKGSKVLIHAGASGVGSAAIQLANHIGCEIFTTAGTEKKLQLCSSLGANVVINYKKENFSEVINQQTNGTGVDVLLDFIGAPYASLNADSIALDGRWILIGLLGGNKAEVDFSKLLGKRVSLIASTLRGRSLEFKIDLVGQFQTFIDNGFKEGLFHPVIDSVFDWKQVNEAHQYMEDNKNMGKIVLTVN